MTLPALIDALTAARRQATTLVAANWAQAVRHEADAHAVQDGVASALGGSGRHWKSGGASRLGPFSHAPLAPAGVQSSNRDASLSLPRQPLLGIEAEVALRLARPVTPAEAQALQPEQAGHLVDSMCVAVECIASRWAEGLAAPELLRLADHQSNAGLLLGPWQPYRALDWATLAWRLSQPDAPDWVQRGGHSLADPAWVLPAWLRHLTRAGATVPAGTVVTTGAWAGLMVQSAAARAGACCRLEFDGLGALSFSAAAA